MASDRQNWFYIQYQAVLIGWFRDEASESCSFFTWLWPATFSSKLFLGCLGAASLVANVS